MAIDTTIGWTTLGFYAQTAIVCRTHIEVKTKRKTNWVSGEIGRRATLKMSFPIGNAGSIPARPTVISTIYLSFWKVLDNFSYLGRVIENQ